VSSLRLSNDEKEGLLQTETEARRRAEQEALSRNTALERAQRDLAKVNSKATALRNECRRARRLIIESAAQIRELVNAVRSDAMAAGVELNAPPPTKKYGRDQAQYNSSDAVEDADDPDLGSSSDPLGMADLTTSLESLKSVLVWIQEVPKERQDLVAQVGMRRRLERVESAWYIGDCFQSLL